MECEGFHIRPIRPQKSVNRGWAERARRTFSTRPSIKERYNFVPSTWMKRYFTMTPMISDRLMTSRVNNSLIFFIWMNIKTMTFILDHVISAMPMATIYEALKWINMFVRIFVRKLYSASSATKYELKSEREIMIILASPSKTLFFDMCSAYLKFQLGRIAGGFMSEPSGTSWISMSWSNVMGLWSRTSFTSLTWQLCLIVRSSPGRRRTYTPIRADTLSGTRHTSRGWRMWMIRQYGTMLTLCTASCTII